MLLTTTENIPSTTEHSISILKFWSSPVWIDWNIAKGIVRETPSIFPAKIIGAPNSPGALAKPNNMPPEIPKKLSLKVIVKNILMLLDPSDLAIFSRSLSTDSKAIINDLAISGKETNAQAKIAANFVNTISIPISFNIWPTNPAGLKVIKRKYPKTTGGKTKGSEIIISVTNFNDLYFDLVIMIEDKNDNGILIKVAINAISNVNTRDWVTMIKN